MTDWVSKLGMCEDVQSSEVTFNLPDYMRTDNGSFINDCIIKGYQIIRGIRKVGRRLAYKGENPSIVCTFSHFTKENV